MTKEVKVPEGVTIEPPKPEPKEQPVTPDVRRNWEVDPSLPQIVFPHYTNNKKTELCCVLLRPDGSVHKEERIPADDAHPVYRDIIRQFTKWELEANTARQIHQMDQGKKAAEAMDKDMAQKQQRSDLWDAKQEYLKLPCMSKPEFKNYKREIRKSQTVIRAQAFAIAAIVKDFDNESTD
jgi:hypothetical protein